MSMLDDVKRYLRVIHDDDDDLLTRLIAGAQDEARQFLGVDALPEDESTSDGDTPGSVLLAICCLVKSDYECGPEDASMLRQIAERKLMPYRQELGA